MTYTLHHFETLLADDWRVRDAEENEIACFSDEGFARLFMLALDACPEPSLSTGTLDTLSHQIRKECDNLPPLRFAA